MKRGREMTHNELSAVQRRLNTIDEVLTAPPIDADDRAQIARMLREAIQFAVVDTMPQLWTVGPATFTRRSDADEVAAATGLRVIPKWVM